MRLAVVHHEIAPVEAAGRAELVRGPVEALVEDDAGVAERAERGGDGDATARVVDDLVPDEDLERIGPRVTVSGGP